MPVESVYGNMGTGSQKSIPEAALSGKQRIAVVREQKASAWLHRVFLSWIVITHLQSILPYTYPGGLPVWAPGSAALGNCFCVALPPTSL